MDARKEGEMIPLDCFEAVVWKSHFAVGVLGNVRASDFELVNLDTLPLPERTRLAFHQRGFEFLGVIALHDGQACCAFTEPLDERNTSALAKKFLENALNARVLERVGDEREWLSRLYALPDLRKGMEN